MIGQEQNKQLLMNWRINKSVPRFIIIEGDAGSGRLTLAKVIMKIINATGVIAGNSISDIREIIENAYTVTETTCYIFRDCDDMSVSAKNSLLKVVEEPPNKAYFIMTVKNIDDMLGTIRSRATCIKMQPYTKEQLKSLNIHDLIVKYTNTPGQALNTEYEAILRVESCVNNVINALKQESGINILKETGNLKSKESETDKIDCELFLNVFIRFVDTDLMQHNLLENIEVCKQEMKRNSINKKASVECMLIRLLEEIKSAKVSKMLG